MFKKLIALLVVTFMTVSMVACGSTGTPAQSNAAGPSASSAAANPEGSSVKALSEKTVKLICPYGVGGTADAILRKYALVAGKLYPGTNFVVENMTGGDGFAACTYYAERPADTKELIMFGFGASYRHDLGKKFGTEVVDWDRANMQPIANIDDRTWIVYAAPGTTMEQVIAKAKAEGIKMSGGNPLSDPHLAFGSLMAQVGGKAIVVPYDGGAQQMKALKDGEVDVFVGTTQAGKDETEAGNIVPILSFSNEPFKGFSGPNGMIEVPTLGGDKKSTALDPAVDYSASILPAGGFIATRTGADQAWIDEITELSKAVWAEEEFSGWMQEIMLNVIDQYNEDAIKALNDGCEKAIAAFELLSK